MRPLAALAIVVLMSGRTSALAEAPSANVLADMGLSDIQVMTDADASAIRGSGFRPGGFARLHERIADFHERVDAFHERVADFQDRIDRHIFKGKDRLDKSRKHFDNRVNNFHRTAKNFRH